MQTNPSASSESSFSADNINLRHYWHVMLERRWLVVTTFISVFVLCLVYLYKADKIYSATARLQIDREQDNVLSLKEVLSVSGIDQDYLQTQYKKLASRSLIESVFKKLKLDEDLRYKDRQDKLKAFTADLTISPIRLSRLVDVKVEHTSPNKASEIANTLADLFVENNINYKKAKTMDVVMFLRAEETKAAEKLALSEKDIQDYRQEKNIVSLDSERNTVFLALAQSQEAYAKAKSEAKTFQTTVEELDKHIAEGKTLETFPMIGNDIQVKQTQVQWVGLENELAGLLKRYKEKHPNVITARSKVAAAKESVQTAARQVADSLRSQARIAKRNEEGQLGAYKDWEDRQMRWNEAKMKYDVLNRKAQSNKLLYDQILVKMKELEIAGSDTANNIRVVDPAIVPLKHIKPRVVLTLLLGLFCGVGMAVGLAFFVNYLDDSIKSQDDVETYLRLPFLGYVPNIKTNSVVERDLQAHLHPQSNPAEAFRTVRAALALAQKADRLKVISVTSTIPSEGKSLVASNLAIVIAQTGVKTLLVDTDLRRPSVHKAFQLHSPIGLAAYLLETTKSFDEMVHTTEVPNLDVVCCGATPQQPSELVGSKRMQTFLQEALKRYERVVLDCPPVSAVSDPLIVSAMADGVVFVTKFNKIRREHARKTVQRIQDSGIHICGLVLNDIDFEGRDSYYYSYYYYQNRYYASHYKTGGDSEKKKAETTKG